MITNSLQKQKSLDLYLYINKIVLIYQQTEKRHDYICPKLLKYASGLLDGYWAQLGFSFLQLTDLERSFMCPRIISWVGILGHCPVLSLWYSHSAFSDPKTGDFPSITESIECRQGSPNHALIFLPLTLSPAINILQRDLSWQFRWLIYQVAKSPASFLWVSIRSCRANRKEIMLVFLPPSAMLADETLK